MAERQGAGFVMGGATPLSFSSFLLSLASTALVHLGEAPHPETGKPALDLVGARETIDVLELLAVKTQGNLSAEEAQLLADLLLDLRLRFVKKSGA